MKRFLIFLCVLLIAGRVTSQNQVDSLLHLALKAPEKQKTELYLKLANSLKSDSAKSNNFARQAYRLAEKNNQPHLQAKALLTLAENYYKIGNFQLALQLYQKHLSLSQALKDTAGIIQYYISIGLSMTDRDEGNKGIEQFIEGMRYCEEDTFNTGRFLFLIGRAHNRMHNFNDAIQYYRKALVALSASKKDTSVIFNTYTGLGETYKTIQRRDSALINYLKAKNLAKNPENYAISISNLAGIYLNYPDSIKKAALYLKKSWSIFRKLGRYRYEAEFKEGIGIILYKQRKYDAAIEAFKSSIELNDKYNRGFKIKSTCNNLLSRAYEKLGDYKTSLEHMKLYVLYSDSMMQKEKYDRISDLEKRYESEKKENQIASLKAKQELTLIQLKKNKQLKQLGLTTALLLLLLLFFIWLKYLDKNKSNRLLAIKNKVIEKSEKELRLLNASKNKFFSIIAHDLKNPLHNVLGYSYLLNSDYDKFTEDERRKFAGDIYQSTNNIFRLLQNLLEWSKSQTGRLIFSPEVIEYQKILDSSLSVLTSLAEQKNIEIKTGNDPELKIYADPVMIETVLRNLINNAIKFTPAGGHIEVSAHETDGQVVVSVSDTGIGISEEESQNLFRIDSKVKRKGTNNEDGSGLGLILCHEFVDKHHGKIWVESTPGHGSEFIFSIPTKAIA